MPAQSIAQKNYFSLVNAYKKGGLPKSAVSKSIVETAKSMTKKDIEAYLKVKKNAPDKVANSKRNGMIEDYPNGMDLPSYEDLLVEYLLKNRSAKYIKI